MIKFFKYFFLILKRLLIFSFNLKKNLIYSFYKNKNVKPHFIINNLVNLDQNITYKKEKYTDFKIKLQEFMDLLKNSYNESKSLTIYKFGDGDFYFLKKIYTGTARPGNRDISRSYDEIGHHKFVNNSKKNDIYTCEVKQPNPNLFYKCFSKTPDYYAEFCYILVSNKWIFKNFSSIGLIGPKEKLKIIKKLMNYKEYQNYLGIEEFKDYIDIPEKFACDYPDEVENYVGKKLRSSNVKIYLIGIGLLKNFLLCNLKKYHDAIYLDVGNGIDALTGITDKHRPYFGNWINYQFKDKTIYNQIHYNHYPEKEDFLRKFID